MLIWPKILAVTSGVLYKYKRNLNFTEDSKRLISVRGVLVTILENFHIPELSDLHMSRSVEIVEICKSENCEST